MEGDSLKRKLGQSVSAPSLKKVKLAPTPKASRKRKGSGAKQVRASEPSIAVSANNLPWKAVVTQGDVGFGDEAEGGMLMLEEVEDVEVVYGKGETGNVVGFRAKERKRKRDVTVDQLEDAAESVPPASILIDAFDIELLPAWGSYPLHPALLHSLHKRGFEHPTEIQKRALEVFLNPRSEGEEFERGYNDKGQAVEETPEIGRRDIVGVAETGSGKTLAYGLPILHHLLTTLSTTSDNSSPSSVIVTPPHTTQRRPLQALILAPTRELALQVSEHLNACLDQLFAAQLRAQNSSKEKGDDENDKKPVHKAPPPVSVAAIVGGMSAQKQRRILSRGVDVLVATPGRLWDLCGEDPALTAQLGALRFLVLDEADRMVEAGHFQELDGILRTTIRPPPEDDITGQDPAPPVDLAEITDVGPRERNDTLQTFVFSATMSKELQRDLKRRRSGRARKGDVATTLDDLLMKLDFRDPDPFIIDLSPEGGRVESLQESKVECLTNDKDAYLYYFLLRHPGRSLVFLSSIDGIRRLLPMLELLTLSSWPLHSGLQQKQRLKNLDRFKSTPNSVLLATDVAARGLDVPAVDHVIHYQVPRTADAYVHRNGRTARAMRKGFGLVLCAPDERRVFRGVLAGLGRGEDDVPELNVELNIVDRLKARVQLARQIDSLAHRAKKTTHDKNWMRETAEAMEIELPSDLESDVSDETPEASRKRSSGVKLAAMKAKLKQALAQPLVARGVSTRYITSGTRSVVDDLIEGEQHETMLGLKKLEAGSEVVRNKKKKKTSTRVGGPLNLQPS